MPFSSNICKEEAARETRRCVAIYAEPLLATPMTFISAQGQALKKFEPLYISLKGCTPSRPLPFSRTLVVNPGGSALGRIRELPLRIFGRDHLFAHRIKRFNPVLMHAHFGPVALTALPLARSLGIPLITTLHGSDATVTHNVNYRHRAHRVYAREKQKLIESGAAFIAISEFILAKLLEQGFPPEKVVRHYIGVDTTFFQAEAAIPREPIVLFVATMTEVKGADYLISAMKEVQRIRPEVELLVIGGGPLRRSLELKASKMLFKYRFLGEQPPEIVRQWMNRARVFCVPSITMPTGGEEGLGLVFLEAQAMGLPVVSSRSGGIPEAVAHDETGLLVEERDCDGLVRNILELLSNEGLWLRLSRSGRAKVCSSFDLFAQTRKLESIYESVLQSGRAKAAVPS